MKMFEVLNEGIIATFQDNGRFGYDDIGVSNSGASDELSYHLANRLLNNPPNSPTIELSIGKLKLKALNNTRVSIAGANTRAKLNSQIVKNWSCFPVKKGDILEFGYAVDGQLTYMAVEGGFECEKILSSVSVSRHLGTPIKKGDILYANPSNNRQKSFFSSKIVPTFGYKELELRFVKGYQYKWFDIEQFTSSNFKVSNRYNKMGYQLEGDKIFPRYNELISEAIAYGAIQITSAGQPIILLKDRQTIGGYPKIGSVLPMDCFKLSQCGANTKIRFKEVSLTEATKLTKAFYNKLKSI